MSLIRLKQSKPKIVFVNLLGTRPLGTESSTEFNIGNLDAESEQLLSASTALEESTPCLPCSRISESYTPHPKIHFSQMSSGRSGTSDAQTPAVKNLVQPVFHLQGPVCMTLRLWDPLSAGCTKNLSNDNAGGPITELATFPVAIRETASTWNNRMSLKARRLLGILNHTAPRTQTSTSEPEC